jgi:hypothetical protein
MVGHGYVMRPALAAMMLALCAGAAQADAIDGQWCNKQGSHGFRYVAPAGEAEAGQTVEMTLFGDDDLDLTTGPVAGPRSQPERWRRCQVTS